MLPHASPHCPSCLCCPMLPHATSDCLSPSKCFLMLPHAASCFTTLPEPFKVFPHATSCCPILPHASPHCLSPLKCFLMLPQPCRVSPHAALALKSTPPHCPMLTTAQEWAPSRKNHVQNSLTCSEPVLVFPRLPRLYIFIAFFC